MTQREADQFCKLSPQSPCCKSLGSKRVLAAGIQAKAAQNGTESGSGTNNGQTNASPSITLSTAQSSTPTSVASTTTSAAASSETAAADTSSGTSSDPSSSGTPEKTAEQEESDAASAAALEEEEQKKKILIIGASVGSFVLLMAVITCWACASRRRQKSDSDSVFGQSYATGSHLSLGSSSMKSSPVTPMSDNIMKNIGGNTVQVVKAYNPNLSDEVQLRVGDSIKILEAYDDGEDDFWLLLIFSNSD